MRGVGKSSVAKQIKLIASGEDELVRLITEKNKKNKQYFNVHLEKFIPNGGFNFLTRYHTCDSSISDVSDLVKRLILGDDKNPSLFQYTSTGDKRVEKIVETFKAEGSVSLFGAKVGGEGEESTESRSTLSDNVIHQFKQLLGIIRKDTLSHKGRKDNLNYKGILFIIDEFDVLKDKTGFASLIKTCSDDYVKFMIVGIASTISELIEEHQSINRQIKNIEVRKMTDEEMWGIIVNAERFLGKEIEFTDEATELIINKSDGFPYFTHLLGSEALLNAYENGSRKIDMRTMEYVFNNITSGKLNTMYEEAYHKVIKSSKQKEILLKCFADEEDDEINVSEIYSVGKELGVTNPSNLTKELITDNVLSKVRDKYYRFTDPMFKVYVKMRNWKF